MGCPAPGTLPVGQNTHAHPPHAVMKTARADRLVAAGKDRHQGDIGKGIAGRGQVKADFGGVPLLCLTVRLRPYVVVLMRKLISCRPGPST